MAHTNQQRKRIRQDEVRYAANGARRSRVGTFMKKFEDALKAGDTAAIGTAFTSAMSELTKAAQKGALGRLTAARRVSRLAARVKAASAK